MQFEGRTRSTLLLTVWDSDAPLKCNFFAWLACLNRCLTADNMLKHGWPCDPICPLCRSCNEPSLQILLHCPFSCQVWCLVQMKLQITLNPRPTAASSLNLWWLDQIHNKPKEAARSMNTVINLVCWSLWKERNARVFNNLLSPPSVVFSKVVEEATVWLAAGKSKAGQLARRPLEPD